MKEKFVTFSGSEYIIDYDAQTWERKRGENAATIRTDSGEYNTLEFINRFGFENKCIYMTCPPINPEAVERYILSTEIVSREILDG